MKFTRHDLKQLRYPQHNIDTISLNYLKLYECYVSPCIAFLFLNFLPYYGRGGWGGSGTPEMTCGFLIQLVFCKKNYVVYWC